MATHTNRMRNKWLFLLVGAAVVCWAATQLVTTARFVHIARPARGEIFDVDTATTDKGTSYFPWIRFVTADGQQIIYRDVTGAEAKEGDVVQILYDPRNPYNVRLAGFSYLWSAPIAFGLSGLFWIGGILGIGHLVKTTEQEQEWARAHGQRIEAKIVAVNSFKEQSTADTGMIRRYHSDNYWVIQAQWLDPATNKLSLFDSEPLSADPRTAIQQDTVTVFLNPQDPHQYWMDLSFLPQA